jgi:hypothetical protein
MAASDDIGVENKAGIFKELCNAKYIKNVTAMPIAIKIAIFLSIFILLPQSRYPLLDL